MITRMKILSSLFSNTISIKSKLLAILFVAIAFTAIAKTPLEKAEDTWRNYRTQFPQPYRAIACQPFEDGSRVYILAEPPNIITLSDIERCLNGYYYKMWTRKWTFGYDGWVKDVLIYVNGVPDFEYENIAFELNRLVYGSTHNSNYIKLPLQDGRRQFFTNNEINLHINAASIHSWLMEQPVILSQILTGEELSFKDVVSSTKYGVYRAKELGLVLYCLPTGGDITHEDENIRIFTTESDLILGAIDSISRENKVTAIIGRERQINLIDLPPMRTDELKMLAATREKIGQSLNLELCCSKLPDGSDWCPAWVSSEIEQTEYAHLLTQSDNYLKFWLDFPNYHQIGYKPFTLPQKFNATLLGYKSVRYNWNTKDYMQQTIYPDCRIYTVQNTSMINKTLFDDSKGPDNEIEIIDVEQPATEFFLKCGNVDIARVAQYTTLHLLFNAENITSKHPLNYENRDKEELLLAPTIWILNRMRNLSDEEIDSISLNIYHKGYFVQEETLSNEKRRQTIDSYLPLKRDWDNAIDRTVHDYSIVLGVDEDSVKRTKVFRQVKDSIYRRINNTVDRWLTIIELDDENEKTIRSRYDMHEARKLLNELSYSDLYDLSRYIASPNTYIKDNYPKIASLADSISIHDFTNYPQLYGYDVVSVVDNYSLALIDDTIRWYKQPTLDVTNNMAMTQWAVTNHTYSDFKYTGGHSIDTRYKSVLSTNQYDVVTQPVEAIKARNEDALETAEYYGNKAVVAVNKGDPILAAEYARKSREAMSGPINISRSKKKEYNQILTVLERTVANETIENNKKERRKLKNDCKQLYKIAERNTETSRESETTNQKNVPNDQKNEKKDEKREIQEHVHKTLGKALDKLESAENLPDEELAALIREVRRLSLILSELQKNNQQ